MKKKYDYVIVGSGLYGATFAWYATRHGKKCLVVERRSHTGGNLHCEYVDDITVHIYGPHIFHTSDSKVWDTVNSIVPFKSFINTPLARYGDKLYHLPFNMNTFYSMWGCTDPSEAEHILREQRERETERQVRLGHTEPQNLEEQALRLVGRDIYETLIKGYTEKQWGRPCDRRPAFIIKRLPVRYTYDNNYFNDPYQGIPVNGYNEIIDKLLDGIEVRTDVDYLANRAAYDALAEKVVYTGTIDSYFDYKCGELEYRSLRFETEVLDTPNYQGVAVVNYTDRETPYTRIIEHKHFAFGQQEKTVITREYPAVWQQGMEAYYPVNNEKNSALYQQYKALADAEPNVIFGGRLAEYKYYDMDKVIEAALSAVEKEFAE